MLMFYHVYNINSDNHNRVYLNDSENFSENYINASFINGPLDDDKNMFIATQGPLNNTKSKFWQMIMKQNIKLIIMLSHITENGRVIYI
jgi:protein tyrosine phosphatase